MNYEEIHVMLENGDIGRFEGVWLNDPQLDDNRSPEYYRQLESGQFNPRFGHSGAPEEWRVGVAETFGGVLVYVHHWNYDYDKPSEVHRFKDIDEARRGLSKDPRVPSYVFDDVPRYTDI